MTNLFGTFRPSPSSQISGDISVVSLCPHSLESEHYTMVVIKMIYLSVGKGVTSNIFY